MKKPSVSMFVPAYYDEKNLPILIPKAVKVLKKLASKFEIIIVDDGSPDKTGKVADSLALKFQPFIKVVRHKRNKGYGAALKTGFKSVKPYDFVFYTDGDNQYDVEELEKMIGHSKEYAVIVGYRRKRRLSFMRNAQTRIFNFLVGFLFGISIKDVNCSMKLINSKALRALKLSSDGAFIDAELLIKLIKRGYGIKQIPVTHFPRKFGKASGGNPAVILKTIHEMINFYRG